MFRLFLCTVFVLTTITAEAQIGGDKAYRFLNLTGSPRQAALGGNNITNYDDDVNQGLLNPAAINHQMDNRLALNFGNYYGSVFYGSAAYAKTLKSDRTFHVGVTYLNYGSIDGYDENGMKTGTFSGNDLAISLGYALPVADNFYVGAQAKFISSVLENYKSIGAAVDLAATYSDPDTGWNAALTLRNIGTQITTYNDINEDMPFEVTLGVSKKLENVPIRWHLTFDQLQTWKVAFANPNRQKTDLDGTVTEEETNFFDDFIRHVTIGAELFPENKFNLRLAYNFRRGEEMRILEKRHFSGLSVGVGIEFKRFAINYSYSRYTIASNTSLFGLIVKL